MLNSLLMFSMYSTFENGQRYLNLGPALKPYKKPPPEKGQEQEQQKGKPASDSVWNTGNPKFDGVYRVRSPFGRLLGGFGESYSCFHSGVWHGYSKIISHAESTEYISRIQDYEWKDA